MKYQNTSSLSAEQNIFSDFLQKKYFFTEEQINEVLSKTAWCDILALRNIVDDVVQQYAKVPMGMPIADYLYETLKSVEPLDIETKQKEIVNNVGNILDGNDTRVLSYNAFCDDAGRINHLIRSAMDFFVIHIDENIAIDKGPSGNIGTINSNLIQQYLPRSWLSGINFYVFVQKDGSKDIVVGIKKWTQGMSNDLFFADVAKKYHAISVSIPLSKFVIND